MPRANAPYANAPRLPEGDVDLRVFLPGSGVIELEIGPGRGGFIRERAAGLDGRILGIELRRKWASIVDARLANEGLGTRARVVCEDARHALARLGPDGVVARVFVCFPDPWWKKRHQKRAVLVEVLLEHVARLLADDGDLFVQTDVPGRAELYRSRIDACALLEPAGDDVGSPWLGSNPYGALSNRERRANEDGLPVHRLRYRRRPRLTGS